MVPVNSTGSRVWNDEPSTLWRSLFRPASGTDRLAGAIDPVDRVRPGWRDTIT